MYSKLLAIFAFTVLFSGCAVHRIFIQTKPDIPYFTTFQREKNLGFLENIILDSGDTVSVFEIWNMNPGRLAVYRLSDSTEIGYVYLEPRRYPKSDAVKMKHGWMGPSNISKESLATASPSLIVIRLQRYKGEAAAYLVFENADPRKPVHCPSSVQLGQLDYFPSVYLEQITQ